MNDSVKKIQVLVRAQSAVLRLQVRRSVQSLVLVAVGLVFALLAVGVLNFAGYAALEMRFGPGRAGLIVGCIDLVLAGVLFAKGLAQSPPTEEEALAREITEMATEGLGADLDEARNELREFMTSTRRLGEIVQRVTSIVSSPAVDLIKFVSSSGSSTSK